MKTNHHSTSGAARLHSIYSKQARRWFSVLVGCIGLATAAHATEGPVAQWKANGNASDASGAGNDGTLLNGASFTAGHSGQAFAFDGSDDFISVPHSPTVSFAGDFSIEGWVNVDDPNTSNMIITKGPTTPNPAYVNLPGNYELRVSPAGELEFGFEYDGPGYFFVVSAPGAVPAGQWAHVAAVFTSATSVQLFINGAPAGSSAHNFTVSPNTLPVQIGRRTGGNFHFSGAIDDLALYDRALSPAEISAIYSRPVRPETMEVTEVGAKGTPVPGAGGFGTGIPAGAVWVSFGVPAINDANQCTVLASYKAGKVTTTAILAFDPRYPVDTMRTVAKKGDAVQYYTNTVLGTLKDPVLAPDGSIAWVATLVNAPGTTGAVTAADNVAVFLDADGGGPEAGVLITRKSYTAPAGATFKGFTSLAIGSQGIWFTATLGGEVTAANDSGLYAYGTLTGLQSILREGDNTFGVSPTKTINALVAHAGSPGQGHGVASGLGVDFTSARAIQADGRQVLTAFTQGSSRYYYTTGNNAPGYDSPFTALGIPTQNSVSAAMAFIGTVKPGTGTATTLNNVAIFAEDDVDYIAAPVVAKGDAADGVTGGVFAAFRDPVNASGRKVAFIGSAKGGPNGMGGTNVGVTAANNDGIWATNAIGEVKLVAREGDQVPNAPESTFWKAFTSLALPEGSGPIFTATLRGNLITSANDTGLWATDSAGALHLVLQEGDAIGTGIVKTFTVLGSVAGSPAQTRSFNNTGSIVVRVTDMLGAQHLLHIAMP